ncbi:hypothetical protein [Pseudomonas sp. NBRC 100443]|uniref:hypothetical protein n=1 Tax=Pseudomonas sp. NBRC 100443 TaxID=1113665 RepID=UPI00249FC730|nr:hypothetical protein [Pseudomonas sp. NBRC 100443]GLU39181.1 hypothetical protein Pssp01_32740 [Pseudomonas sp. NBRC 100443]
MMSNDLLFQFKQEVLDAGPESTLPCNLSENWLGRLSCSIERYLDHDDESGVSLVLGAIVHILMGKSRGGGVSYSVDQMFDCFMDYRIELALEEIRRKAEIFIDPATLENIFTNRDVEVIKSAIDKIRH